jgi:type IV secretory pathway component VirB8
MSEQKNVLEGTKMLSITDSSGHTQQFASEVEREVYSLKLRYYVWLARLFILTATVSLGIFASSSLVLFKLAPIVTVEPFLIINQDSSDQMVRYEAIRMDMASQKKLMELFIRQYIIVRHTIISDEVEMKSRWYEGGMVNFMSSWPVFYTFQESYKKDWKDMFKNNTVREVEIISISKVGGENSPIWKVDFKTYDLTDSNRNAATRALILKTRYWTASLTAHFLRDRQFVGLRLINPLGFTVTRYSQTEVEI